MKQPAHTLRALLLLTRPINALMAAGSVMLGWWTARSPLPPPLALLPAAAAALALAFGNVVNDIRDREADRTNHPSRPLPRGDIPLHGAVAFALILACASLLVILPLRSPLFLLLTAAPLGVLVLYSMHLKGVALGGNATVAALSSYTLLYGATGGAQYHRLFVPALLVLCISLLREIIKDLQDCQGDRASGLRTSAALSVATLQRVVGVITLVYAALLFLPWLRGDFGPVYALGVLAGVVPLGIVRTRLFFSRSPNWATLSMLCKYEMLAGLLSLGVDEAVARWW